MTGVVWDLGNVLIDWDPLAPVADGVGEEEARRFFAEFDFGPWNLACDAGRPWSDALEEVRRTAPRWHAAASAYHRNFARALSPKEDSAELVADLAAAGVHQIGLTNFSAETFRAHADGRFPVLAHLRDVVVSGEEGITKPDPRIYRLAAQRAGLTPDSLVFLDDVEHNVEGARAVGMAGVRFTDAGSARRALRDLGLPV
ncbi:HAD family hydrolase [Nocardioides sambongensis]|uniref:HAD family hydrolase n=1 Tax=Nocardioides sambongensis TaxID=2589074 RepID=UPI001129F9CB|nr:HAD family phosphatase [Nocardioides sambongensis]